MRAPPFSYRLSSLLSSTNNKYVSTPKASAIFCTLSSEILLFSHSRALIYVRCSPAFSAKDSWDMPIRFLYFLTLCANTFTISIEYIHLGIYSIVLNTMSQHTMSNIVAISLTEVNFHALFLLQLMIAQPI